MSFDIVGLPLQQCAYCQSEVFDSIGSTWSLVSFGLPNGFILGPLVHICSMLQRQAMFFPPWGAARKYTDDTQGYIHDQVAEQSEELVDI